jgi:hypothetical protein
MNNNTKCKPTNNKLLPCRSRFIKKDCTNNGENVNNKVRAWWKKCLDTSIEKLAREIKIRIKRIENGDYEEDLTETIIKILNFLPPDQCLRLIIQFSTPWQASLLFTLPRRRRLDLLAKLPITAQDKVITYLFKQLDWFF